MTSQDASAECHKTFCRSTGRERVPVAWMSGADRRRVDKWPGQTHLRRTRSQTTEVKMPSATSARQIRTGQIRADMGGWGECLDKLVAEIGRR
jgi:hypothetical protein